MKSALSSFLIGVLFALGLGLAGMTQPQKVVSFLDIFGNWDPSLIFVMIGAIGVHFILFKMITKRKTPVLTDCFHIPNKSSLDKKLIIGAALFGLGWGLVGYCPAPAVTALATMTLQPFIFVLSMLLGMVIYKFFAAKAKI